MARNRQNLNIIYISDRMRETLRPIASCALTAVVAPMGYGKTTAVRWFLAEQAKAGAVVLQASIYSDNRSIFWKSVQKAFAAAGLTVLEGYDCPADASGAALLLEDLCAALGGKTPYYLFLDDFHLLGDERVAQFLCRLAYRLPENVHLIVASRNRFLPGEQVVRLGRRLHHIEADGLRLNREELLAYTHRCGVEITAAQAESLLRSCEGWFSAVYLNLHALAERGSLLQPGSDIYAMFTAAYLKPADVLFTNGVTAGQYLPYIQTLIDGLEADCAAQGMEFNWFNTVDGVTFLDYVEDTALAHFGVTAKDGTQLYQDFDMQVYYSRYLDQKG